MTTEHDREVRRLLEDISLICGQYAEGAANPEYRRYVQLQELAQRALGYYNTTGDDNAGR